MHEGATIGRRFTLLRPSTYDLPGVERWVARDVRRATQVTVDVLTSPAPGAVREQAVRASHLRDARFSRVLATGRELHNEELVTFIATETPPALSLATLAGHRIVPPPVAAAIVGEAARALDTAKAAGVHHGYVRAAAFHLMDTGRVVISGLGIDGQLATQAGLGQGQPERADALALARLYLTLVTGMAADDVTAADLPEELRPETAEMARSAAVGRGPATLATLASTLRPIDRRLLREVSHSSAQWAWVPGSEPAPLPARIRLGADVSVSPETPERARLLTALATVRHDATPGLAAIVQAGRVAALVPRTDQDQAVVPTHARPIPATSDEAARFSTRTQRAARRKSDRELGLDTWETMVADHNRKESASWMQVALEWLHRRWPQSESLTAAAAHARERARRPGPLNTGPVVISMFLVVVLVAGIVAFEVLLGPDGANDGLDDEPPSHYPEFTFSPEPSPDPSTEAES